MSNRNPNESITTYWRKVLRGKPSKQQLENFKKDIAAFTTRKEYAVEESSYNY